MDPFSAAVFADSLPLTMGSLGPSAILALRVITNVPRTNYPPPRQTCRSKIEWIANIS
jgi:hypothetical protein